MKHWIKLIALTLTLGLCAAAPAADKPAPKKLKIAMIAKSSTNPVFLSGKTGAETAAKELSKKLNMEIVIDWRTPPNEDAQIQAQRISQSVNDGVDAILLSCSDASKVTGAINDAVARDIPVMCFDSDAPASKRFAFYGVDDAETGQRTMAELAKILKGKGNVAILSGNQNAPNLKKRVDGAKEEAKKYPGIKVVGVYNCIETPQDAAAEVVRVNNANPEINAWAMIGGWPLFTKSLLNDIDPKKYTIVSVDALPAQLPYIEKGITPMLLAQSCYLWGYVSVEKIVDKIVLKKEVPVMNKMELVPVTKETLGKWARQLKAWGFTDVPEQYLKLP